MAVHVGAGVALRGRWQFQGQENAAEVLYPLPSEPVQARIHHNSRHVATPLALHPSRTSSSDPSALNFPVRDFAPFTAQCGSSQLKHPSRRPQLPVDTANLLIIMRSARLKRDPSARIDPKVSIFEKRSNFPSHAEIREVDFVQSIFLRPRTVKKIHQFPLELRKTGCTACLNQTPEPMK